MTDPDSGCKHSVKCLFILWQRWNFALVSRQPAKIHSDFKIALKQTPILHCQNLLNHNFFNNTSCSKDMHSEWCQLLMNINCSPNAVFSPAWLGLWLWPHGGFLRVQVCGGVRRLLPLLLHREGPQSASQAEKWGECFNQSLFDAGCWNIWRTGVTKQEASLNLLWREPSHVFTAFTSHYCALSWRTVRVHSLILISVAGLTSRTGCWFYSNIRNSSARWVTSSESDDKDAHLLFNEGVVHVNCRWQVFVLFFHSCTSDTCDSGLHHRCLHSHMTGLLPGVRVRNFLLSCRGSSWPQSSSSSVLKLINHTPR